MVVVAGAIGLSACGGSQARKTISPTDAIVKFSAAPEQVNRSFAVLNQETLSDPSGVRKAALEQLTAKDPDVHYAAVYALSLTATRGPSLDALVPILKARDITQRILAAETLVAQQDKRGVPVLIDALDSTAPFAHWSPPRRAWEEAQRALLRFVPADLGLGRARTVQAASIAKRAWAQWWARHGAGARLKPNRIGAP